MSNKKMLLPIGILLVSASLSPAIAAPSSRTVSVGYEQPNTIVISAVSDGPTISTVSSEDVATAAGDRRVSATITDDSGQPVAAQVHQGNAELGVICGTGSEELTLVNRKPIHLHLLFGPSPDCTGFSMPTTGTIDITFKS